MRRDVLEQLEPLPAYFRIGVTETGDVTSRMRKARHETLADGVRDDGEDDRNGRGCAMQGDNDRRSDVLEQQRGRASAPNLTMPVLGPCRSTAGQRP